MVEDLQRTIELDTHTETIGWGAIAGLGAGGAFVGLLAIEPELAALGSNATLGTPGVSGSWLVHLTFATLFGGFFGLLVDSRPAWQYARGVFGPAFGAVFGVLLWVGTALVLWPLWLGLLGPAGLSVPGVDAVTLVSYAAYGTLVGGLVNVFGLLSS